MDQNFNTLSAKGLFVTYGKGGRVGGVYDEWGWGDFCYGQKLAVAQFYIRCLYATSRLLSQVIYEINHI